MKSLQVVTPHMECLFNCPFCIAKAHNHENNFIDYYHKKKELWQKNFINVLKENPDLGYVVITGTNEPMQSPECVLDIINLTRKYRPDIKIEIQTRWYIENDLYNKLDVVCYSISNYFYLDKIKPMGKISRYVFILTDSFNNKTLQDILDIIPKEVTQLTFKTLQNSITNDTPIDEWINKHRIDPETLNNLEKVIKTYQGDLSIRLDKDCMTADNRYKVFREDGDIYNDWDELPKEKSMIKK
jgi:organic radical activating enzyme